MRMRIIFNTQIEYSLVSFGSETFNPYMQGVTDPITTSLEVWITPLSF